MKKNILILAFGILFSFSFAQDTVVLHHKYYTSTFIKSKHIPLLVEFSLTKEMLTCESHIKRTNKFASDPELPDATNLSDDYAKSGYDRGHNMSAKDNSCDKEGMKECFYFSNMFPQIHSLNAGVWEQLERHERDETAQYGRIKVFVGNLGEIGTIGNDKVVVPEYCWKVIYNGKTGEYECFIMPNKELKSKDYKQFKVELITIENKSGIKFQGNNAIIKTP